MKRDMKPESFYAEGRNEDGSLKKKKMKDESPLSNPSNNGTNGVKKIYLEAALDYNRTFNKVHNVTGTLFVHAEGDPMGRTEKTYNSCPTASRAWWPVLHTAMITGI